MLSVGLGSPALFYVVVTVLVLSAISWGFYSALTTEHQATKESKDSHISHLEGEVTRLSSRPPERFSWIPGPLPLVRGPKTIPPGFVPPPPVSLYEATGEEAPPVVKWYSTLPPVPTPPPSFRPKSIRPQSSRSRRPIEPCMVLTKGSDIPHFPLEKKPAAELPATPLDLDLDWDTPSKVSAFPLPPNVPQF